MLSSPPGAPKTLAQKVWDAHCVAGVDDGPDAIYVDLHLLHEVSSPFAFDSLRATGRRVRRPDLTVATEDHSIPTIDLGQPIADQLSRAQVEALRRNCAEFGIELYSMGSARQGIVHVMAPELGLVLPGMTIACGDSHTSTSGAFGALAIGTGASDVEHVLTTQTLRRTRPGTMAIEVDGGLRPGVTAKDLALAIISSVDSSATLGHILEYRGEAVRSLSMEGRLTLCNMSVEAGASAGMIAPDDTTFAYLTGRPHAPTGPDWEEALSYWRTLPSDEGAVFDRTVRIDGAALTPYVTWGTRPAQAVPLDAEVPAPAEFGDPAGSATATRALTYMGLQPGMAMRDITVDTVFIGSCTNARIEDLRAAAEVLRGRTVALGLRLLVVPGSAAVRRQAETEGLDEVFVRAGGQWRGPGCSMCLDMSGDVLRPGERSASTTNRNFEGRQGAGGRTHLVSPMVAAATAVAGHLAAPDDLA